MFKKLLYLSASICKQSWNSVAFIYNSKLVIIKIWLIGTKIAIKIYKKSHQNTDVINKYVFKKRKVSIFIPKPFTVQCMRFQISEKIKTVYLLTNLSVYLLTYTGCNNTTVVNFQHREYT